MEINGVRFSAGFDREGLFRGHSASIVLDWLNETGKPSGWGTGKEVKIDNLSLSDLKVLSDSINKYIKAVEKSNRHYCVMPRRQLTSRNSRTSIEVIVA